MSDTYGGGLDLQSGAPLDISPSFNNGAGLPDTPPDMSQSAAPAQPQASGPTFGSSLKSLLPGPHYDAPDPQASALDQSASLLNQRISRASSIATNPLAQIFAPEQVQAAREFVPKATEQLQTIKSQQQQQVDIQKAANNFGVPKSVQSPFMTNDTIDNWLLDQYKDGDFSKAKMLRARGKGDWVQDFAGTAVDGAGARLAAANTTITKLSAAGTNQGAYAAALRSLSPEEKQAVTSIGLQTIPEKAEDWQGLVQQHGAVFAQAQQTYSQTKQRLNNITNFDGTVPKDVETASQGDIRIGSTNEAAGLPVRTRAIDGQTGGVGPNGSVQMEKYGLAPKDGGWNVLNKDRTDDFNKRLSDPSTSGAINQYNIGNRFKNEALNEDNYTSAYGMTSILDSMGGTFRDVAEKSAAAGNIGLSKFGETQKGGFEGWLDRVTNNVAAYQEWVRGGKQGAPPPNARISDETKRGIQLLAKSNYDYVAKEAQSRLSGAMRYAGQIGMPLSDVPLDPDLKATVAQYHEEGRADAINGWRSYPSLVRGNQRIFFPEGSNVNGANPPRGPLAPVQQPSAQPTAPGSSSGAALPTNSTPTNGSAGQPVTVAGQQVNVSLPSGASPAYVNSLQRIESGGKANPWTATTSGSSASGAYQFTNQTWKDNRPAGAPDRAGDATPDQQTAALQKLTATNATALQTAGLPVNDTNLYVAHNLGANGGASLLKANPNADARTVVGEVAAKNNPTFFRGRPTVAVALGRYQASMAQDISDNDPRNGKLPATPQVPSQPAQGNPMDDPARIAWNNLTPEQQAAGRQGGTDILAGAAPAAGSTAGALIGGAIGGPLGAVAGGAIGGGAGASLKNYIQGKPQSPTEIAEQAALGGVLGVASEARPLLTAAGQVAGSGAIEAGTAAAEGGSGPEITDAGLRGGAEALGGRLFGHALGMAGNKIFSLFTSDAQKTVQSAAKDLHEANQTLATEQPKLPSIGGAAGADNPKYVAAQAAKEKAEQTIKDTMPNVKPDEAAYAHKVTSEGTPAGEAVTMARVTSAKNATSAGYNQLRQDVQDAGVGTPKANQPLPDGPLAQIRTPENPTAPVQAKFTDDAQHAEMLLKAPAANWGEKWGQMQDAGKELIQKRLAFIANGDKPGADAMDNIFQGVRKQQSAAANYVFGPVKGPQVISRLEQLDKNWATVATGSGGFNYAKMQQVLQGGNSPEQRAMETAFKSFAGDDPVAMRAFNAMKAGTPVDWKMMIPVVAGEVAANAAGIPTLGAVSGAAAAALGGQRLYRVMRQYMNAKVLDQTVKFKDFYMKDLQGSGALQAIKAAAQRGAVQGGVLKRAAS